MSVSVGIRMPDETKKELDKISAEAGITRNVVIQIAVEAISCGNMEIKDGKLVPTSEYLEVLRPKGLAIDFDEDTSDLERLGFDGILRLLRKKKYPDNAIRRLVDQLKEQIMENGDYNPRRSREDWA